MPETAQPTDLAPVAPELLVLLERLLPVGHSLTHTKNGWHLKKWDSYWSNGQPRMDFCPVDSDPRLEVLLGRLEEQGHV